MSFGQRTLQFGWRAPARRIFDPILVVEREETTAQGEAAVAPRSPGLLRCLTGFCRHATTQCHAQDGRRSPVGTAWGDQAEANSKVALLPDAWTHQDYDMQRPNGAGSTAASGSTASSSASIARAPPLPGSPTVDKGDATSVSTFQNPESQRGNRSMPSSSAISQEHPQITDTGKDADTADGDELFDKLFEQPCTQDGAQRALLQDLLKMLSAKGACIIGTGDSGDDQPSDLVPTLDGVAKEQAKVAAFVVTEEIPSTSEAHDRVRQLAARNLPHPILVLLLPGSLDQCPARALLEQERSLFQELGADAVHAVPDAGAENLDNHVDAYVDAWLENASVRKECARGIAGPVVHAPADEAALQAALAVDQPDFWERVHQTFSGFPRLCPGLPEQVQDVPDVGLLTHVIGSGTFGCVFQLEDVETRQPRALKVVAKDRLTNPRAVLALATEIQVLERLSHPSVVHLHSAIHTPTHILLLMELAGSRDLFALQRASRGTRLPAALARRLLRQVASGIKYCHEQGVCHRAIKPGKVAVSPNGCTVKLVGFGFASDLAVGNQLVGTVPFMAPEVMAQEECFSAAKADVWSLGAVFLEMLLGLNILAWLLHWRLPAQPSRRLSVDLRVLLHQPQQIHGAVNLRMGGQASPHLLDLVHGMLRISVRDRWTAGQVVAADWLQDSAGL